MAVDAENTAPPSTPTTASQVFSSDAPAINGSSPVSSPPAFPWDLKDDGEIVEVHTKQSFHAPPRNIFSMLGKRKLAPISEKAANTNAKKVKRSDDGKTQMQLHLGQKIRKRCKDCGMQYVASSNEDRAVHAKFHRQQTEGVDVGIGFIENAPKGLGRRVYDEVDGRQDDRIVLVDCFDKKPRRRKAQEVLEIVQRDLGAVEISETDIWDTPKEAAGQPRYRSFMYVRGGKCVGYLLVESIQDAFEVLPPTLLQSEAARHKPPADGPSPKTKLSALAALKARKTAAETARAQREALLQAAAKEPLVLSKTKSPASLGICRIWTLSSHRGQGIAISLLDAALHWHIDHVTFREKKPLKPDQKADSERAEETEHTPAASAVGNKIASPAWTDAKRHVAFSQPTAAGTGLARKWMGKVSGWNVYVD